MVPGKKYELALTANGLIMLNEMLDALPVARKYAQEYADLDTQVSGQIGKAKRELENNGKSGGK